MPSLPLSFSLVLSWVVCVLHLTWEASMKKTLFIWGGDYPCLVGVATHPWTKINSRDSQKLVIYNWGTISIQNSWKFTEESSQYETFDSSAKTMYIPRSSRVERPMILPFKWVQDQQDEGRRPLGSTWLFKNRKYRTWVPQPVFDSGNKFSIPLTSGDLGIVYNETMVDGRLSIGDDYMEARI